MGLNILLAHHSHLSFSSLLNEENHVTPAQSCHELPDPEERIYGEGNSISLGVKMALNSCFVLDLILKSPHFPVGASIRRYKSRTFRMFLVQKAKTFCAHVTKDDANLPPPEQKT